MMIEEGDLGPLLSPREATPYCLQSAYEIHGAPFVTDMILSQGM